MKRTSRRIKKNTKRRIKKNTKQMRNKIKLKNLRNSSKNTIRKMYKNKFRCKRGGSSEETLPLGGFPGPEPSEPEPEPDGGDESSRALMGVLNDGGNISIFKDQKASPKTLTLMGRREGGMKVKSSGDGGKDLIIFMKECKRHELINKELEAGLALGEIDGVITPITLQYLGFGDSKLPVLVEMKTQYEENKYYIMYEFVSQYTLENLIETIEQDVSYTIHKINLLLSVVMEDILKILEKIHSMGWVHNDIKPPNIMVSISHPKIDIEFNEDGSAKYTLEKPSVTIIDLDGCEKCKESCEGLIGPPAEFLAPSRDTGEGTLSGQKFNGIKSDLASLGLTILYIYRRNKYSREYLYDYNYIRGILSQFCVKLAKEEVDNTEEAITLLSGIKEQIWATDSIFKISEPEPVQLTQEEKEQGVKVCSECGEKIMSEDDLFYNDDNPVCETCFEW